MMGGRLVRRNRASRSGTNREDGLVPAREGAAAEGPTDPASMMITRELDC